MDKYKKSLILLWSAMGAVVIACIAFLTVGILLLQYQAGLKAEVYFTVAQNGNDYLLSDGETLELEFACTEGESVTIQTKAYYTGELRDKTYTTDFSVPLDSPQTYELKQVFNYNGKEAIVKINVKVIDPTPAPVLKLDDDGSCEFEAERRYVYRYDGNAKFPEKVRAYDGESGSFIGLFDTADCNVTVTTENGERVTGLPSAAGVYKCDLVLSDYGTTNKSYKASGIYGLIIEIKE